MKQQDQKPKTIDSITEILENTIKINDVIKSDKFQKDLNKCKKRRERIKI